MMNTHTIALGEREEIRVEPAERSGKRYIDVRVYGAAKPDEAKWPTGKGVLIPAGLFRAFKEAVLSVDHE